LIPLFQSIAQPTWEFAFTQGTSELLSGDAGHAVTVDSWGDFYVIGTFAGDPDFQGNILNSQGLSDIFVAKYDWSGSIVWVSQIGGPSDDFGNDIAYDPVKDQVLIIGNVRGDASGFVTITPFDTGSPLQISTIDNTGYDILVASFDGSTGAFNGEQVFGGTTNDSGNSIAVNPYNGEYYITGKFSTSGIPAYFGTDISSIDIELISNSDLDDIFVAGYNSSGQAMWAFIREFRGYNRRQRHPWRS
ncbi:MAG: hypothetical protein IID38_06800, partial [Planctomycetes bacterium]|nr:hypothetical protein [Planctomycetota bacterium]